MNIVVERARLLEIKEAFKKLHWKTATVLRDTLWRSMALFCKICSKIFPGKDYNRSNEIGVGQLFNHEFAQKSIKTCLEFGACSASKTSLSALF